jgi:hypothetical protein
MLCFDCSRSGESREAVGLCHHCSAALCAEHARTVDDPVSATYAVCQTVVLPKHARLILCDVCRAALEQSHDTSAQLTGAGS